MEIMKKYIVIILLAVLAVPESADARNREREQFELRKHEFSLSGAFFPGRYAFGYPVDQDYGYGTSGFWDVAPVDRVENIYQNADVYCKEFVTDTWTFGYACNFSRILAVTTSLSYEGGWMNHYDRKDDRLLSRSINHFITAMVGLRVSWLNRKVVRMYSSAALGVTVSLVSPRDGSHISGQFTPFGISFGGNLFGFVEAGLGVAYMGGCAGIGYRF